MNPDTGLNPDTDLDPDTDLNPDTSLDPDTDLNPDTDWTRIQTERWLSNRYQSRKLLDPLLFYAIIKKWTKMERKDKKNINNYDRLAGIKCSLILFYYFNF